MFVRQPLGPGARIKLDGAQSNYLANVMRMGDGAQVLLFDGHSGEWLGEVTSASKKQVILTVVERTRLVEKIPDLWLAFAPVKRAQIDWLIEKATELGIARLIPVITQRTVIDRVKVERLEAIAIEAAEQCGRTRLPELLPSTTLRGFLTSLDPGRMLYFADENGGAEIASSVKPGAACLLIGPEGGFTDQERDEVRAVQSVTRISLGPRILRAETAALAGIAVWMALAGDWR